MRTLQVIETVKELSDCFKSGQLEGCTLIYSEGHEENDYGDSEEDVILLRGGADNYVLSLELTNSRGEFLKQLFAVAGIPMSGI